METRCPHTLNVRRRAAWRSRLAVLSLACGIAGGLLAGAPSTGAPPGPAVVVSELPLLTSLRQYRVREKAGAAEPCRVRMEAVVRYYDPTWKLLWGEDGEDGFFLEPGSRLPIKAGQRVRIEGRGVPRQGFALQELQVTALGEAPASPPLETRGQLADSGAFQQRFVWIEGYVEHQTLVDPDHLRLDLRTEGLAVIGTILLNPAEPVPQLEGALIRARGTYVEPGATNAVRGLWVSGPADLQVRGWLATDPRFALPVTSVGAFPLTPVPGAIHLQGVVSAIDPGRTVTLHDATGDVLLYTAQNRGLEVGAAIEVFGEPRATDAGPALRNALWRARLPVAAISTEIAPSADFQPLAELPPHAEGPLLITSISQFWMLLNKGREEPCRLQIEADVSFYDPEWNQFWGDNDGTAFYLEPGIGRPVRSGQRVRVEGTVVPAKGLKIQDLRLTVLGEAAPAEPLETRGRLDEQARFHERVVWMEGYVESQTEIDSSHVGLDLVVDGRRVVGRIRLDTASAPQPQLEGALVRARGVLVDPADPSGKTKDLALQIPQPADVQILGWLASDSRFALPETALADLVGLAADQPRHVRGIVYSITKGRSIVLRDQTGQVVLATAQNRGLEVGAEIEAVGYPVGTGSQLEVRNALWRPAGSSAEPLLPVPAAAGLPKLRLVEQVLELSPSEADRGYPVRLQGEVLWSHPQASCFFLLDGEHGMKVAWPAAAVQPPPPFTTVALTGASAAGSFAPVVAATSILAKGKAAVPEARLVTLEQLLTGAEEAHWVEIQGYLREVVADGPWTRLDMTTSAGEFSAMLPGNEPTSGLPGAVLRLQGVCSAIANDQRELTAVQLWVPSREFVHIEEPAPGDPFAVVAVPISSLRQFGQLQTINRRVRTHGVVLHQEPGRYVLIQDGAASLQVLTRASARLVAGQSIEVVGFPGREGGRIVLREAQYRVTAAGRAPVVVPLDRLGQLRVELDGRLVAVEASLVQLLAQPQQVDLTLQRDGVFFDTVLNPPEGPSSIGDWAPGCSLAVTGVYRVRFDEYRRPSGFYLALRTPGDVRVLARPPWWTIGRALGAAGVLATCSGVVFLWVVALRRRVRRQTSLIREQLEARAQLETELARASRLESLGVLAGGIAHDFNNMLTAVMGNLTLVMLEEKVMAIAGDCLRDAERGALRARDLTQQLLTFSKGGSPLRAAVALPELVRESAKFALHGTAVRSEFAAVSDLWSAEVDKGQIGQVVHNLALNAVQAMPHGGVLRISLCNVEVAAGESAQLAPGRYVRCAIADTGEGIKAESLERIFEPYFSTKQKGSGLGLAMVYSIVRKHQGHITVESEPGRGTTFELWLPAAGEPRTEPAVDADSATTAARSTGRILIMDDDEAIRRLGATALQRSGFAITCVDDGAAAVREFGAARAAGRPYDLVIFDLTVPAGMGGREAIAAVRRLDPTVLAIVSSGYSQDPVMADHRAYGFDAMVPKPYEIGELIVAVERLLVRRGPQEG